jgi:hypothetical protein
LSDVGRKGSSSEYIDVIRTVVRFYKKPKEK